MRLNIEYASSLTQIMAIGMDGNSGRRANARTELNPRNVPPSDLRFPKRRSRLLTKTSNSVSNPTIQAGALLPPRSVPIISSCVKPGAVPFAPSALHRKDKCSFSQASDSAWAATESRPSREAMPKAIPLLDRAAPSHQHTQHRSVLAAGESCAIVQRSKCYRGEEN